MGRSRSVTGKAGVRRLETGNGRNCFTRALTELAGGYLSRFAPRCGEAILIEASTVHAAGNGGAVFGMQESDDITFRLCDREHIDTASGGKRRLQVNRASPDVDFHRVAISPTVPVIEAARPVQGHLVVKCPHFAQWRMRGTAPFPVGATVEPRFLACLDGIGRVKHSGAGCQTKKSAVSLLPAVQGVCRLRPDDFVEWLEITVSDPP